MGIGVSGTRQFAKWPGMADRYDEICYKPALSMYTHDGELLGGPWPARGLSAIPTPISRPKLITFLYDVVVSLNIPVIFGEQVVDYHEDMHTGKAKVVTMAGKHHEADLVVAADGVGSKSSKLVLAHGGRPQSSGFAVYRTAFPTSIAHENIRVAEKFRVVDDGNDDVRMYLGPDTHAITLVSKDITTWLLTHRVRNVHLLRMCSAGF